MTIDPHTGAACPCCQRVHLTRVVFSLQHGLSTAGPEEFEVGDWRLMVTFECAVKGTSADENGVSVHRHHESVVDDELLAHSEDEWTDADADNGTLLVL